MKEALTKNGVSEDAISIIADEVDAIDAALNAAQEKDLLIVIGDNVSRSWKQIINFGEDRPVDDIAKSDGPIMAPAYEDLIDDTQQLIRDERGVRLARDHDEDGD